MNLLSNMQQIADLIIRPSRYLYKPVDLGSKTITLKSSSTIIHHHDYQIKNAKNQILRASLYTPQKQVQGIKKIIIYLHCNSGCRIQALAYLNLILEQSFSYFVFDFAGSGVSDGKYISLGFNQADDIKCIVKYLRKNIGKDIQIGLWGRSMGAVAALRFLAQKQNQKLIKAAIFDSPFYSLKQLFIAIGRQKTNLPRLVLEMAMKYLKPIILEKAKFDIDNVNLNSLHIINRCPGIFIASKNDSLIPFKQMDTIFKQYGSSKQMFFVEQSHNQPRNLNVISDAFKTMAKCFNGEMQLSPIVKSAGSPIVKSAESRILESNDLRQQQRQDASKEQSFYRSQIPSKEVSRKKLQLTIKSYSQKALLIQRKQSEPQTPKKCLKQISFPQLDKLEKRQISCLFQKKQGKRIKFTKRQKKSKDSFDDFSSDATSLNSSLNFHNQGHHNHVNPHRKAQITIRKFFKQQTEDKNKEKGIINDVNKNNKKVKNNQGCYDHINLIKLNSNLSRRVLPLSPKQNENIIDSYFNSPQQEQYHTSKLKRQQKVLQSNNNIGNIKKIGQTIPILLKQQQICSQKILCGRKQSVIKLKDRSYVHGTHQQRKTMQHIANKKPPTIQNHRLLQLRNSFEGKYKSQILLLKK